MPLAQLATPQHEDGELLVAVPDYQVRLFATEKPALAWLARRRQHETV
jgi:hypothetical protein